MSANILFRHCLVAAGSGMGGARRPGGAFVSKDGVAWGQGASMVFDPYRRLAVVAFSNALPDLRSAMYSGGGVGAADIAQHLLRPQIPMGSQSGTRY